VTNSIDDELHRLNKEFDKLLGISNSVCAIQKTTPEQLIRFFGLTTEEAKGWLESEPNFIPSDGSYHAKKSDDKLTEPHTPIAS